MIKKKKILRLVVIGGFISIYPGDTPASSSVLNFIPGETPTSTFTIALRDAGSDAPYFSAWSNVAVCLAFDLMGNTNGNRSGESAVLC